VVVELPPAFETRGHLDIRLAADNMAAAAAAAVAVEVADSFHPQRSSPVVADVAVAAVAVGIGNRPSDSDSAAAEATVPHMIADTAAAAAAASGTAVVDHIVGEVAAVGGVNTAAGVVAHRGLAEGRSVAAGGIGDLGLAGAAGHGPEADHEPAGRPWASLARRWTLGAHWAPRSRKPPGHPPSCSWWGAWRHPLPPAGPT